MDSVLNRVDLPTLELRRLHADLVMCYKLIFGLVKLSFDDFFSFNPEGTHTNSFLTTVMELGSISLLSVLLHHGIVCLLTLTLIP